MEKKTNTLNEEMLLVELENFRRQGVTIRLEGDACEPQDVTSAVLVCEGGSYMRDYVFNAGALSELRFDYVK